MARTPAATSETEKAPAASTGTADSAAPEKSAADLVTEIGTLTYPRAVQNFGKDRAIEVLRKVAEIGGHGYFEDDQFKSPLFGGLQMPDPEKIAKPKEEDFAALPEAEFHFQAALETFEENKRIAADNRQRINELYKSIKS